MDEQFRFTYFSDIEEHFCRRRGTALMASTLDWALIETWKNAGIPLEAVLRGIDATFDKYDARPSKTRKVNSLAYCSQEVLAAAEEMTQAAEGASRPAPETAESGFGSQHIADFLLRNAAQLESRESQDWPGSSGPVVNDSIAALRKLATGIAEGSAVQLEDLERRLTVIEDKIHAALLAATPDDVLVGIRAEADRDIAPYRSKMIGAQIEQLHKQYVHKRLFERYGVPRLSLFYM